jgi:hypothetical protein
VGGLEWTISLRGELRPVSRPSRAWVDYPGHIWAENWGEGAFFSPDGLTVQFDNGNVWHRVIPAPADVFPGDVN